MLTETDFLTTIENVLLVIMHIGSVPPQPRQKHNAFTWHFCRNELVDNMLRDYNVSCIGAPRCQHCGGFLETRRYPIELKYQWNAELLHVHMIRTSKLCHVVVQCTKCYKFCWRGVFVIKIQLVAQLRYRADTHAALPSNLISLVYPTSKRPMFSQTASK